MTRPASSPLLGPFALAMINVAAITSLRGGCRTGNRMSGVRDVFGRQHGFASVFMQWFQNLCWYPVVLTFAAASLGFAIDPQQSAARLMRTNLLNFQTDGKICNLPLYAVSLLPRFVSEPD